MERPWWEVRGWNMFQAAQVQLPNPRDEQEFEEERRLRMMNHQGRARY